MDQPTRHTAFEDFQGLVFGSLLCAFGVLILTTAGLVTGQTAGLAVLISHTTGWAFGPVFFVVNLPFYALALAHMGGGFTLRTFAAVALLSGFSMALQANVSVSAAHPALAAVLFGCVTGGGLLAIFRHRGSLGGIGILALHAQERFGWRAGWVQLGFDAVLFLVALAVLPPMLVVWSLLGAGIVNAIIAINHRSDRYIAT